MSTPTGGASTSEANPIAELIAGFRRLIPEQAGVPVAEQPTPDWDELARAVDELVDVVMTQQDLIENLLMRMSRLEAATLTVYSPPSTTQESTRTSQYARSWRRTTSSTDSDWPGSTAIDANALSSRGARSTTESASEV